MHKQKILDHGYIMPMATSRGPLCTAGFVRSTTNLMIELVENPEGCHRLIDLCTRVIIDWLKAQHRVMGDTVESIFILDDIVGFINEEHYQEFAHPYLKRICDAFPKDWVKVYHNDAEVDACLDYLPDCGFNVLNWGKQKDIREVKQRVGDRMCLMGNVNPLEIGVRGTPEDVQIARGQQETINPAETTSAADPRSEVKNPRSSNEAISASSDFGRLIKAGRGGDILEQVAMGTVPVNTVDRQDASLQAERLKRPQDSGKFSAVGVLPRSDHCRQGRGRRGRQRLGRDDLCARLFQGLQSITDHHGSVRIGSDLA